MVERLWRSLKYENIYLHAYETGSEARRDIGQWIEDYNQNRGHRVLMTGRPMRCIMGFPLGLPQREAH
jgi:hypothetical protein